MTFQQELRSWFAPKRSLPTAASVPMVGEAAPTTPELNLATDRPTLLVFLRHCGCPFAEKNFRRLRALAIQEPWIDLVAVSQSDQVSTDKWLKSLPQAGSESGNLRVVVDESLEAYATWGLGTSGFLHALSPSSLYQVYQLGKTEGIWNRPTESGSRWQTGGTFVIDATGKVVWGRADTRADDLPDFDAAIGALQRP